MGFLFQHGKAGAQNPNIAAELVDDKPFDARPFVRLQQFHRAKQLGKHAAAVNITHQQHRGIHQLGQPHVHDVVGFQVDFSRAACALDDDNIKIFRQAVVSRQNIGDELFFTAEILRRRHLAAHFPVDDHLAANIAAGLEQNGIHPHIRFHPGCLGLHHLGAAHFQPVTGHKAVQRHVLAFERGHPPAILGKNTAERRAQQAFARAAHGALHHNTFCFAHFSTSRMVCSSCSFSGAVRTAVRYQPALSPG